jgi:malonyl-CoA/methylmalonyl-CoA synthetase
MRTSLYFWYYRKAKGAMLTHQNLFSNAKELVDLWEITGKDTLIHSLPIFHTHGLFVAINTSMIAGSSIRFIEGFNIDYIIKSLNNSTLLMGVPTFYTRLLNDERLSKELTKNMRLFISGSAPLLRETHENFEKITGHKILERYGMTETNMNTSNPYKEERKAGSVGKPLKNIIVRVVNSENEKVLKSGEIGMIQVKGPNVFKGYLNMPDKTQESFTKDGFFISGDLGSFDEDGYLSITGRNKDLIISGGYNIYPKEIEDIINSFDKVIECAVFGINDEDLGEVPVAVVVMKQNENDTLSLKGYVEKKFS